MYWYPVDEVSLELTEGLWSFRFLLLFFDSLLGRVYPLFHTLSTFRLFSLGFALPSAIRFHTGAIDFLGQTRFCSARSNLLAPSRPSG